MGSKPVPGDGQVFADDLRQPVRGRRRVPALSWEASKNRTTGESSVQRRLLAADGRPVLERCHVTAEELTIPWLVAGALSPPSRRPGLIPTFPRYSHVQSRVTPIRWSQREASED